MNRYVVFYGDVPMVELGREDFYWDHEAIEFAKSRCIPSREAPFRWAHVGDSVEDKIIWAEGHAA